MTTIDEMDLEIDLFPEEIAGLFVAKGWQLAGAAETYPLPHEIDANICNLVELVMNEPATSYATLGRIVVFRDSEFPNSVEIALVLGSATVALGDDADEPGEGSDFLV